MPITETLNEGLRRGYAITVPAADLDAEVTAKLQEAQPDVALKGFRKGKVPMAMLRKQHGPRLLGEAMQASIDREVNAHMEASGDRPAMQPTVKMRGEDWKEGDDVVVDVTYERLPDVPELDLSEIALTRLVVTPDEAAVDEAVGQLAAQGRTYEAREGAEAKTGDQVVLDFVGRIDGEPFEGGSATDYALVLGSNSFVPGFEDGLLGARAGEERDVAVTFPEGYGAKHLAGRVAAFSCTVKAVKEPVEAAVDDALAQRFGAATVDELRAQVADRLGQEYGGASRAVLKRQLLDALDARVDFDLPPSLVDAEAAQVAHQLWHEEHPEEHGHDHGHVEPTEEHRRLARRRVKLGLLLADVGTKAEVKVTDAELTQAILAQARQYRGQERQFFEYVQKTPSARQQIQAPIFEDKVVDHVVASAAVTDQPATKAELEAAVEALDRE